MWSTKLRLVSTFIVPALMLSGCTDSGGDSAKSTGNTPSATQSAAGAMSSAAPAGDDTKTACVTVNGDIKDTLAKVADAEKIGPPAGYNAVSAQYSAGAAVLYSHAFNTSTKVNDAAKKVADAMSDVADAWAKNPKAEPDKTALIAAITQLATVCSAS